MRRRSTTCCSIGRREVLAGACALLASPAVVRAEAPSNGVALVIGNSKYKWEASLPNVKRDAPDVAKAFQALGLRTELVQDASQNAMRVAIEKFSEASRGTNLAAFYFAGHGASWDKDTFLVPQDADLANPSTVQQLVSVRSLGDATKEAQHRLLVFDSCRNNPADGWRQRAAVQASKISQTELAATTLQGPNTLLMFSTAPGRVAVDGPAGDNSPFAAAFLRQLTAQSIDLQSMPAKLRRDLLVATEGRQVLWDQSTYKEPFLLAGARSAVVTNSVPPTTSAQIIELPNAYAFARDKGLLLPPGLVALRPLSGSPDSQKTGSFETTMKTLVGTTNNHWMEPLLLVVLSVDGNAAEIIYATRDWQGAGSSVGKIWRYSTATISGSRLEFGFYRVDAGQEIPQVFKWRNANSGTFECQSFVQTATFYSTVNCNTPFTRLD